MRPIHALTAACLCLAGVAPALAQQSVSIDLANVQFRNATNVARSSSPATLAPAVRYRYEISGNVRGQPFLSPLYFLFPNPVPIAEAMETLAPGSSDTLRGTVANPDATHPFMLSNIEMDASTDISGITVTFAATISAGLNDSDHAFFTIQDVVLTPTSIGYLQFTTGSVVVTRLPCPANFSDGGIPGPVNSADITAFLSAWLADVGGSEAGLGDYNLDGLANSADITAFLTDWLAAVASGCPQ